jgi:hypothetical protein
LVAIRAKGLQTVTDDARLVPQSWAGGPRIDTSLANVARAWNFMVGGKDNFEADRAAARQLMEVAPVIRVAAPASRMFLGRVVRFSRARSSWTSLPRSQTWAALRGKTVLTRIGIG